MAVCRGSAKHLPPDPGDWAAIFSPHSSIASVLVLESSKDANFVKTEIRQGLDFSVENSPQSDSELAC